MAAEADQIDGVQRYERMRDATQLVPAERPKKKPKPMDTVPKHTEEELLQVLGVDPQDPEAVAAVENALADIDWDAVPWPDEESPEDDE